MNNFSHKIKDRPFCCFCTVGLVESKRPEVSGFKRFTLVLRNSVSPLRNSNALVFYVYKVLKTGKIQLLKAVFGEQPQIRKNFASGSFSCCPLPSQNKSLVSALVDLLYYTVSDLFAKTKKNTIATTK